MKFLFDFFPILLFFAAYKVYDIFVATAVAIVATVAQVSYYRLKHGRFEKMHVVTLVLIVSLGGATLVLKDPMFIKWKPSIVNWLFAVAFLGSQFIGKRCLIERMMSHAVSAEPPVWLRLNMSWVLFFLAMGFANLYVVYNFDEETWVNFKLFGMMGLTFAFVLAQAFYLARYMKPEQESSGEE
jgi:intracellular septation protein